MMRIEKRYKLVFGMYMEQKMPPHQGGVGRENPEDIYILAKFGENCNGYLVDFGGGWCIIVNIKIMT